MSNSITRLFNPIRIWNWCVGSRRSRPRILVAAGDAATFTLVESLLGIGFGHIHRVRDGFTLVRDAIDLAPDLIVADFETPGLDGIEAAARLSGRKKTAPVVILATQCAPELIEEAFEAGASAYVLRCDAGEELQAAVNSALQGRRFVSHSCR